MKTIGLSLLVFMSMPVVAEVQVLADGTLQTSSCSYGRGSPTVAAATAQATAQLAAFIQGNKSLATNDNSHSMTNDLSDDTIELYEQQHSLMLEGLSVDALPITVSTPSLSGNDTCVTVSLNMQNITATQADEWADEAQSISVTVSGEGWAKNGQTARYHAEMDALQRAVSQVVGVWLTQQHSQSSQLILEVSNDAEVTRMQELIGGQLATHTEGLIKEWQTLDTQQIDGNGYQVTVHAVVEKAPLIKQAAELLDVIGSPRVKIVAPEPLKSELGLWLAEQGVEVSDSASLVIEASSQLAEVNKTSRLHLSVSVKDLSGNVYGQWRNNPALIALPSGQRVEYDLMAVHLAHDTQSEALKASMKQAFTQVVARGGLVRQLWLPQTRIAQPDRLYALLSTMGGVSDVAIDTQGQNIVASLRYKGATGELAQAIHQLLLTAGAQLPAISIENDFTLRYK